MNAAAALLSIANPTHAALVCGTRTLSYAQLSESVAGFAGSLQALGVAPGDRVLLAADDGIDWVAAHLGTIWAGAVSVPLNPRLPPELLTRIVAESGARLLIGDRQSAIKVEQRLLADLSGGGAIDAHTVSAETPALWVYSSGTTAQPKAVVHAHRSIAGCSAFAREVLRAGPQDRFYASSKLFFAYPLANSLYAGLALGAGVILDPRWPDAAATIAAVVDHRATVLFSVPSFYHAMLETAQSERLRDSTLTRCVSAGESLPARITDDWHNTTGLGIVGGYGMSETLALVLYRDEQRAHHAQPAPLAQVRVDSADHDGAPRRLWFRHPSIALGYHKRPELEGENFRDGWCSAGDLFHEPTTGRYVFAGRNDDWTKVSGRWVNVLELEGQLIQRCRDGVRELATVAVNGAEGLSAIAVFAVAGADGQDAAKAVLDRASGALSTYQQPRWIHWLDALPRTASGKLARAALQALHRQRVEQQQSSEGA